MWFLVLSLFHCVFVSLFLSKTTKTLVIDNGKQNINKILRVCLQRQLVTNKKIEKTLFSFLELKVPTSIPIPTINYLSFFFFWRPVYFRDVFLRSSTTTTVFVCTVLPSGIRNCLQITVQQVRQKQNVVSSRLATLPPTSTWMDSTPKQRSNHSHTLIKKQRETTLLILSTWNRTELASLCE